MRVASGSKERLERMSRRLGKRPSETGSLLLEEGLRREEHPLVHFLGTNIGRQAYLEGTRLPIWRIWQTSQQLDHDLTRLADQYQLPAMKIAAALHYGRTYPEEMAIAIADHQALEASWLRGQLPDMQEWTFSEQS